VGAVVPCLPFFLAAPHAFWHEVVADQLTRNVAAATPLGDRLQWITGIGGLPFLNGSTNVAVFAFWFFVLLVIGVFVVGRRHRILVEWYVLASSVVVFLGMFEDAQFTPKYAYFPAAFIAPLLGVGLSHFGRATLAAIRRWRPARRPIGGRGSVVAIAIGVGVICFLVVQDTDYSRGYLSEASDPSAQLASVIPPGTCVISDDPLDLLVANRFSTARAGCPAVVDPFGMYLAEDNGNTPHPSPPYGVGFQEQWASYLRQADYVELRGPFSDFIPWVPSSIGWFNQNFRLIARFSYVYPQGFIDTNKDEYVYRNNHGA
jgi:hypothetical protein